MNGEKTLFLATGTIDQYHLLVGDLYHSFYGLILTLEKTHPYLQGNIVIGIAVLSGVVGLHRYLVLEETGIKVRYSRLWRRETLLKEHIDYLALCKDGIIIQRKGLSGATFHFAMRKKKRRFFERFCCILS